MSEELEYYGDPSIVSADADVPTWLKISYVFFFSWGLLWLYLYWNGATGWIDRGYWAELERVANTTAPFINHY